MPILNEHFLNLSNRYLFQEIARRTADYKMAHPEADIISLGIGDVSRPLAPAVIKAMHQAVDEESLADTFHGYGPERGYLFLREKIAEGDYASRGIDISPDEIFVNDGAKSDTGNIGDLLSPDNIVGITDPVYPVYIDSNQMAGRPIYLIPCTEENQFTGDIPQVKLDIVYLCFPNNPTGAVITKEKLKQWVDYALVNSCIILFDSAYEAFIQDSTLPHSIYEIPGAKECAIEFRSFSKTAGFTGVRCGYTVIPDALSVATQKGEKVQLNTWWERRQGCKFNGASYISQRGAEAIYSPEGRSQVQSQIDYYLHTASVIRHSMESIGLHPQGGTDAPYIWAQTPGNTGSWHFFDLMLEKAQVVITPGIGFGEAGEGWFRMSAFTEESRAKEALERIEASIVSL